MAELVVFLAFFGVAEHIVCFGCFLELFLGGFVAGIFVGVVFDGQLSVGLFYGVRIGVLIDAEHFVVVAFVVHKKVCFIRLRPLLRGAALCR